MEGGPPAFPPGFTCPVVLWIQLVVFHFVYGSLTLSGRFSHIVLLVSDIPCVVRTPEILLPPVWPLPISLATTFGISFDFSSSPYLDVSVQAVPFHTLWIHVWMTGLQPAGLLHSEIHGSMSAYDSPWHIAVSCVLLRLPVPRHSPCALCSLTISYVSSLFVSIFWRNCIWFYPFAFFKNLISLFTLYTLFSFQGAIRKRQKTLTSSSCFQDGTFVPESHSAYFAYAFGITASLCDSGGLKWTRTNDLALIRRAL